MTKTILTLLVGGAAALASLVLGNGLSSMEAPQRNSLVWTQPPLMAPRPGSAIIVIKGTEISAPRTLAWTQPPLMAPRPGSAIIVIKGVEGAPESTA